jgi:hypothetical protein
MGDKYDAMQARMHYWVVVIPSIHIRAWCGTNDDDKPTLLFDNLCCNIWCGGNGGTLRIDAETPPTFRTCSMHIA